MSSERTRAATSGDEAAFGLLASMRPRHFIEATHEEDRKIAYRLRFDAVVERGLADPSRFAEGLERDDDDARSIHVLGFDGETPMGTCRLVLPSADRPLPVERTFGVRIPNAASTIECGRMVIAPPYRGAGHGCLIGLIARSWLTVRERGISSVVAATPYRLVELFREVGLVVTELGEPRVSWGEERWPIWFTAEGSGPGLSDLWSTPTTRAG